MVEVDSLMVFLLLSALMTRIGDRRVRFGPIEAIHHGISHRRSTYSGGLNNGGR